MKKAASIIVSLILVFSLAVSFSACTDLFTTTDFASVDKLEQAISVNTDPVGKTVIVTAEKVFSDGSTGYIVQQGNFDFYLASDPGMVPGNTATFKITSITKQSGTFYVKCTKV